MRRTIVLTIFVLLAYVLMAAPGIDKSSKPDGSIERSQNPDYEPGTIVIKFRPHAGDFKGIEAISRTAIPSVDSQLERFSVTRITKRFRHRPIPPHSSLPDLSRIYKLSFPPEFDPRDVARAFARDPHIEYAEPVYMYHIDEAPNDVLYPEQHHLQQISAPQAWDIQHGDSAVIIAIVDNGTDWEHPDLYDNLWTNEVEAEGIMGVDDDDNGWVDDVHGYDLAEDDPDPTHCPEDEDGYWDHGTHTAGLAAAVTNNWVGGAGVSWNCECMPVKVSYDVSPRWASLGLDGIVYAAENGADVISLSWGRVGSYSQQDQDVIDYANGLGSVVLASGGNRATSDLHYPSSYLKVISVCWVDQDDVKHSAATWGVAIDVCAPGVDILSAIPVVGNPENPYEYHSGSSIACPIVAGLCGLVKSQHPGWTNSQIVRQVVLTADNIDHLNPDYAGLLGSGRINAYRALTEADLEEPSPRIGLLEAVVSDSATGDGDGLFEPGEIITVHARYQNFSLGPATNVVVTLNTSDSDLTIEESTSEMGYFPPDTLMTIPGWLSFSVAHEAQSHWTDLYLDIVANGAYSTSDTFEVFIGQTTLRVVDGRGFPGSTGNIVSVDLINGIDICAFMFDLHFDTDYLSVSHARRVGRAGVCIGFTGWQVQEGVRVVAFDCCGLMDANLEKCYFEGIKPGSGSVADVTLDVAEDTPLGEYELTFTYALLFDYPYNEVYPDLVDGLFTVVAQGDVNGDGSVNVSDVILIVSIILETHHPTPGELCVADCNDDDQVDILDAVCVVNIIF